MARIQWQLLVERLDTKWASLWNYSSGPTDIGLVTEEPWIYLAEIVQNGSPFMPLRLSTVLERVQQRVSTGLAPYRALSIAFAAEPIGAFAVSVRSALALLVSPPIVMPPVGTATPVRWDSTNETSLSYAAICPAGVTWQRVEIPLSAWLGCNEPGQPGSPPVSGGPALPCPILIADTGIRLYDLCATLVP